ncbi:MAG TPA: anthranilate phosphoribosyltransferase [Methylomirabilota bacterium]|jgi:anthranilate phosphoribosyltransferase|nr:anthranilate phosphoribosyltransferase [Methylomirabilota bacterium]
MALSLLQRVENGKILTRAQAEEAMEEILSGRAETPEIVSLLRAMNARPIQPQELAGFASVMRRHAAPVFSDEHLRPEHLIDTCGTGGDGCDTFNISTAAAIVASAAGASVAKHGNRAASSRCGSADVLEALGVRIDIPLQRCGQAIRKIGLGFLFAQAAHSATRHATAARKQIGERTAFNLLGPVTNPAGAHSQLVGVYSTDVINLMAATLAELGVQRAFVVHGADGLDEISLSGETYVAELRDGAVKRYTLTPEDFGMSRAPLETLRGGDAQQNATLVREVLEDQPGPRRDIAVMNAAAALVASGIASNFSDGAQLAAAAISSGLAQKKLAALVAFTN